MAKTKTIFSMRVAALLVRKGHEILKREPNINDLRYDVFHFKYSEIFQKDLNEIMEKIKK